MMQFENYGYLKEDVAWSRLWAQEAGTIMSPDGVHDLFEVTGYLNGRSRLDSVSISTRERMISTG